MAKLHSPYGWILRSANGNWRRVMWGLITAVYLFNLWIDLREYAAISGAQHPARELMEICTQEDFDKSRAYALDTAKHGLWSEFIMHLVVRWTFLGGGLAWQWRQAGRLASKTCLFFPVEIGQSLWMAGLSLLINTAVSLPLSAYSTFWIEQRHGFNQATWAIFIGDAIKNFALSIAIGGPLLIGLILLARRTDTTFHWAAWLLMLGHQIFMILIYPLTIMPLFNKFEPLPAGSLKEAIEGLAGRLQFPLTELYVMDGSLRSSHSNAFFFGLFRDKRIVLYDTLIEQMDQAEIVAVLGHELGHWLHGDIMRRLVLSQSQTLLMFWSFSWFRSEASLYRAFGIKGMPLVIGLMLFQNLFAPITLVFQLLSSMQSRTHEFAADAFALNLGYGPEIQSALGKLYLKNKALLEPDWLNSCLRHSHPSPVQRLRSLQELMAKAQ